MTISPDPGPATPVWVVMSPVEWLGKNKKTFWDDLAGRPEGLLTMSDGAGPQGRGIAEEELGALQEVFRPGDDARNEGRRSL